ncbi:hypothetical protein PsorP6_000898 [Peronosclerospora sorghi]|uniref:Uncharacterized protein n=1 Tax=Peronosclerospora sorghi TaxID=230839 RepID=A0ACC0WUG8_9STRA|nr:hypothetical protein PsorP6_000898 [Peronosclerospora sorghi]
MATLYVQYTICFSLVEIVVPVVMHRVPLRLGTLRQTLTPSSAVAVPLNVSDGPLVRNASLARVCRVCTKSEARYTCPRCHVPYCSVTCYQSHGQKCTEPFFERHVRDEMHLMEKTRGDDEKQQQKTMQQLLERARAFQEAQEARMPTDDNQEEDVTIERLQELERLERSGNLTLESLTLEERKQFLAEVADGRVGKWLELWTPWWMLNECQYRSETAARRGQLILEEREAPEDTNGTMEATALYPMRLFTNTEAAQMPATFESLLPRGKRPSPCLRFNVVEIFFAYALVLRAYNGDYGQDVSGAACTFLDLCRVACVDARYESIPHVCLACLEKRASEGLSANVRAIQDTQLMLHTRAFVLDALRDTQFMLEQYTLELGQPDGAGKKEKKAARKKLGRVHKKLSFYLTWAYVTPMTEYENTATEIQAYMNERGQAGP